MWKWSFPLWPTYRQEWENWPQTSEVILGTILGNCIGNFKNIIENLRETYGQIIGNT
jgi:hypothetical protein